jgi:glycosyltransferase involved in cell wall biosynthesis
MYQEPLISIITVSRNSEKTIEKTIKSVLSQTYKNIEYIVIDGQSNDGTNEIVRKYINHLSVYISEPDNGIFSAMNKGIRNASGDFLYFLNSDDFLVDGKVIEDIVTFIKKTPNCEIVYGDIEARVDNMNHWQLDSPPPEAILRTLIDGAMHHQATFACNTVFQKVGLFQETFKSVGDYEWWLRVASDDTIQKFYVKRTIASYFIGGKSSNIDVALREMFEVQNNAQIYQSEYWTNERIRVYQEIIRNPKGRWGLFRPEKLERKSYFFEFKDRLSQLSLLLKRSLKYMLKR